MAYDDFKDIARRTASDEVLRDKAFNIENGYQIDLPFMVCKFFDKKSKGVGVNIPLEFNEQLPKELRKQIIRKF